jgi:hypothetical protein
MYVTAQPETPKVFRRIAISSYSGNSTSLFYEVSPSESPQFYCFLSLSTDVKLFASKYL